MKLNEIQDLIKFVAKSGVSEVELEMKDVKIIIKTTGGKGKKGSLLDTPTVQQVFAPPIQQIAGAPLQVAPIASAPVVETTAASEKESDEDSKYITIKAPMIGTFYRSSSPDKPTFVNVGDEIKPGKVICIIEAMKLFNEVESEITGKIVKVLVDDVSPIEYDQPLFLVDPS
jgi:acetyl-CoA carboxylase biotin carboxyl carrier protein